MLIQKFWIKGAIDKETRCKHYHSEKDRVAIKFYCCGEYFPCYLCHREKGCGTDAVWPREKFTHKAILCGACYNELTIEQYLSSVSKCPTCNASFNPGCSIHEHLYFETK